jgi:lipooligosaccharide transport system permease protein
MSRTDAVRETAAQAGADERWFRLRSVVAIWWRHVLSLGRVWAVAFTWFVIEPVVVLVAVAIGIGRLVGDVEGHGSYAAFVTPGIIVGTAMFHAIFEASWSAFERIQQGLYETFLTAPVSVAEITLAELAFATTRALISTVALGSVAVVFGWLPFTAAPALLLVAVGVGVVFGAIGLLFAALSPSIHVLSLVFTVVATPLFFFSGAFFPLTVLPEWLQPVAWAAPLTPLVHIGRGFAEAALGASHLWSAVYVAVLAGVLSPLAWALLRRRLLR